MTFWDSVKAFLRREAADVQEGISDLKDRLDAELTRREAELEASPSERLDMIREDIESGGSPLDAVEDKIDSRLSESDGADELRRQLDDDPGDDR